MNAESPGLWIPGSLIASRLSPLQLMLTAQVLMLSKRQACFAHNAFFAAQFTVTEGTISANLQKMVTHGWLVIEIDQAAGNQRIIYPSFKLLTTALTDNPAKSGKWTLKFHATLQRNFIEGQGKFEPGYAEILGRFFQKTGNIYIEEKYSPENEKKMNWRRQDHSHDFQGDVDLIMSPNDTENNVAQTPIRPVTGVPPVSPPPVASAPSPSPSPISWLQQLLQDSEFISLCATVVPANDIPPLLTKFFAEQRGLARKHDDYQDFKSHAYHWLKRQASKQVTKTNYGTAEKPARQNAHIRQSIPTDRAAYRAEKPTS